MTWFFSNRSIFELLLHNSIQGKFNISLPKCRVNGYDYSEIWNWPDKGRIQIVWIGMSSQIVPCSSIRKLYICLDPKFSIWKDTAIKISYNFCMVGYKPQSEYSFSYILYKIWDTKIHICILWLMVSIEIAIPNSF